MTPEYVRFAGLDLQLVDGWFDITHDLPEGSPPTLARADGAGALQFSTARYRGGKLPGIDIAALGDMLREFAERHGLGGPVRLQERRGATASVMADFSGGDQFTRVWYVTNGRDVVLVTYVGEPESEATSTEASAADTMVQSLRVPTAS